MCITCGQWFKTSKFQKTAKGRVRHSCEFCIELKNNLKKRELTNYNRYWSVIKKHMNEMKKNDVTQVIEIKITSSNSSVDLNKINSFTMNFDE